MTSLIPTLVITCSIIVLALLLFFILSRSKSSPDTKVANDNNDDIKQQGAATKPVPGPLATQQQSQNNGRSGRGASSSTIHKTLISDVAHRESLPPSSGHRGLQGSAQDINIKFRGLILYSGYNTTYTEIDEVIVSPYGIFCIEYKDHLGDIFGNKQISTGYNTNPIESHRSCSIPPDKTTNTSKHLNSYSAIESTATYTTQSYLLTLTRSALTVSRYFAAWTSSMHFYGDIQK